MYDIILLHVGSEGLTIIPGEQVMELTKREDASNMRVWFHRHPLGNRTPGWHNWSGTDNQTIAETPLGGIPEIVKWSASIVRTPQGWVGRIDNHITSNTVHVNVLGQAPLEIVNETTRLLNAYYTEVAARDAAREMELKKRNRQYDALVPTGYPQRARIFSGSRISSASPQTTSTLMTRATSNYSTTRQTKTQTLLGYLLGCIRMFLQMTDAEYSEYETSLQIPLFPPEVLR